MRDAFRLAFATKDPEFLANGGRELLVKATVTATSPESDSVESLLASLTEASKTMDSPLLDTLIEDVVMAQRTAAVSPIGENGKPRMLKLSAWIAHAGVPNGNGDAFVAEDLEAIGKDALFAPPYCGMVDYNHDFNPYGAWFTAKYAFDPVAGQYGLLAEGFIFAWRFPELTDMLIAMQSRQGHIDVSMACLPQDVEFAKDANGRSYTILRKPVFFTTSVLDVAPADKDARGLVTEDPNQSQAERERSLLTAAAHIDPTEVNMTIAEMIEAFRKVVAEEQREQFAPMVAAFERLPGVEADLATAQATIQEMTAAATAQTDAMTALQGELAEANAARTNAEARVAELEIAAEAVTTELAALREFKAAADAAVAEAERTARREARLNELNEAARTVLASRSEDVQESLVSRWVDMSDDEWGVIRDSMNVAKVEPKGQYEAATEKEGQLAAGAVDSAAGKYEIDRFFK